MSKIQQQVIFHVKKSSQNFSIDYGLNRLGFFKFRRFNLRDNFLRVCFNNRKRARVQLGILLQRRYKDSHFSSLALKSYSTLFLTYISKYFSTSAYKLYDVNTFSYIYFLNRLFSHLNSFLFNFSFFNVAGFVNLNFFFNLLHLLYPGVVYKNLVYRLLFQTFASQLNTISRDINMSIIFNITPFINKTLLFSQKFSKSFSSFLIKNFMNYRHITSLNTSVSRSLRKPVTFKPTATTSFKKINLFSVFPLYL